MLNKFSTSTKFYMLIFITAAGLIGLGFYGIIDLKKMNDNTRSLYTDRVLCIQQLSNVQFEYVTEILPMAQDVKNHALTFSEAKRRIEKAEEIINTNWHDYKLTYFTPEEDLLVKQTDVIKNRADEEYENLKSILSKEDTLALNKLIQKKASAESSPIVAKITQLMHLQVRVGKEIFNNNKKIYQSTSKNFLLLILLSLVIAISLSFYIIRNIKELIKDVLKSSNIIKKSEEKYRSLLENASDAIYLVDVNGGFIDVNNCMCKMTGYTKGELLQSNVERIIDPEQLKTDPIIHGHHNPDISVIRERRFLRKDGKIFDVEINVKTFADDQVLVIARDITDRKQMEAGLREAELKFRTLAEKSIVGIYIVQNGKFIYVNPRFAEVFGYEPEELINTFSVETVIHESYNAIAAENVRRRLKGEVEGMHYEAMGMKKDGTTNWAEFYGNRAMIEGEPTIIGTMLDITERKRAEELILREKKLSETIINSLPGIFYVRDANGKGLRWNKNLEKVTGYTPQEIEGTVLRGFIADEDREMMAITAEKVFNDGYADTEVKVETKDGAKIPFLLTGIPIMYEGQLCLLGTGIDISSRINAEEELRLSEQKYKLLFESNPVPLCMVAKDDLSIIAVNEAAANLYGYTKDELLHSNASIVRLKEDLEEQRHHFRTELTGPTDRGTVRHVKKDGTIIFVQVIVNDITFNGRAVRLVLSTDITEKLKAEELLKKSEANLKTILDTTDTAYALLDKGFNIIAFNQMAVKFTSSQFNHVPEIGDKLADYFPKERFPEFNNYAHEVLKGKNISYEINYPQSDGSVLWYYVKLLPIVNSQDEIFGLMITLIDITDHKKSEMHLAELNENLQKHAKELAISNAELEQFAYVASHDLQEPLRMITSFMAQLEKKYAEIIDERGRQYIHFAVDGAKRMRQIILDLLDFSRVGRTEDGLEEVNFNKLIHEILALYRRQIEEVKASIIVKDMPVVQAYKAPIRQVFQNLISNSLKYHRAGEPPVIEIACKENKTHYQFSVKDNGIGIASEYFDKIFIIFQRLHNKDEYSGTGMGLAIAKKIIENIGGKIWVESVEGKGSTFYFTLLKSNKL